MALKTINLNVDILLDMKEGEAEPVKLGRRDFLMTAGIAGGAVVGGLVGLRLGRIIVDAYDAEGDEPYDLYGEELEDGRIIGEDALVKKYLEGIEDGKPLEPDPTVIRSTLYHAMRFFGTDRTNALRRSGNVSISQSPEGACASYACNYDSSKGLGVEIGSVAFDADYGQIAWIHLAQRLAHEAYHVSVGRVREIYSVEDYGVLGKYRISGEVIGFGRDEEYKGEVGDLMKRPMRLNSDSQEAVEISVPEEFFAESGSNRYYGHLLSLGLNESYLASLWKDYFIFPFMRQGFINIQDTTGIEGRASWQEWWGGDLSFDKVDRLHLASDRFGFYKSLGQRILSINGKSQPLSEEDTAGLGIVAFADFVDISLSGYEILTSLAHEPITQKAIAGKGKYLVERIAEQEIPSP